MGILFRSEKRSAAHWIGEPLIPPFPGASTRAYSSHTPDGALVVPTVWACVSLLSNAVSMLPLESFRSVGTVPQRTSLALLTTPAAGMTQSEWLHMLMVSLLLRGNAYGRIVERDELQRPVQIEILNPDALRIEVAPDGSLRYLISLTGEDITSDIWHVRGMTMPGSKVGLSPVAYAAATLGIDISSRQFASDFFAGGGIPKATLQSDQPLDQDQARSVKDRLLAATRSREPLVLPAGITYKAISVTPDESQFLATQQANVAQIARYFGIPPEMVGGSGGNSLTYANVEQRQLDFLTLGVSFWLKRIEDAVFPLLPPAQFVKFNAGALLRTDAETQAKVDNMRLAGRTQAPSEIRQQRGEPPMTADQKTEVDLVPLEVTPLGGVKALPALKTPAGPEAPVPADDTEGVSA